MGNNTERREQNDQARKAFVNLAVEPLDYETLLTRQFENADFSKEEAKEAPKKMWRTQVLQSAFNSIWKKRSAKEKEKALAKGDPNDYKESNNIAAKFINCSLYSDGKSESSGENPKVFPPDTEGRTLARRYAALLALQNSPEYHDLMLAWHAKVDDIVYLCKHEDVTGPRVKLDWKNHNGWEWARDDSDPEHSSDDPAGWFASNTTTEEKRARIDEYRALAKKIRDCAHDLIHDFVSCLEKKVSDGPSNLNNFTELNVDTVQEWDGIFYEWLKDEYSKYASTDDAQIPNMVNIIYKNLCESPAGLYGNWVIPSVVIPNDRDSQLSKAADGIYFDGNQTDKDGFTAETLAGWDIGEWCKSHEQAITRFYDVAFAPRERGEEVGGSDRPLNTQFIFSFGNWGGSFLPGWNPGLIPVYNDFHPLLDANDTYWDVDKQRSGNTKTLQFLIRAAFDTPMEGAYMTDFYKGISTGTSTDLYIARKSGGQSKKGDPLSRAMLDMFVEEIHQLSDNPDEKPVLVLTSSDGWDVLSTREYKDDDEKAKLFEPWKVIRWPHQSQSNGGTQKADVLAFAYGRIERALQYIDENKNDGTHIWRWSFNASGIETALENLAKRNGKTYQRPWEFPKNSGEPQMSLWEWLKYSFADKESAGNKLLGKEAVLKLSADKPYQVNDVEAAFVRGYVLEEALLPRDNGEIPAFPQKMALSPMGNRAEFDTFKAECGLTNHTELTVK